MEQAIAVVTWDTVVWRSSLLIILRLRTKQIGLRKPHHGIGLDSNDAPPSPLPLKSLRDKRALRLESEMPLRFESEIPPWLSPENEGRLDKSSIWLDLRGQE